MAKQRQRPNDAETKVPPRQGPRPLPYHLTAAAMTWMSSLAALPLLKNESLPWKAPLKARAADLGAKLRKVDTELLTLAVEHEVQRRLADFAEGLQRYRHHPYQRSLAEPPVLWRDGTTRLLDYGAGQGYPLLVVPSLINRAYILDLTQESSLLRWLAERGLRPLLVDWDRPGVEERQFSLTDYIAGRLEAALDAVLQTSDQRPLLAGYCMGGLLALALAERRADQLAGLALLATPWDFHADGGAPASLVASGMAAAAPLLDLLGEMPVDLIQSLFAGLDPETALRKFLAFARLDQHGPQALRFVALEDWLNDGVPLAAPVARECMTGWYGENLPAKGRWRVAGRPVNPSKLNLPTLCLVPDHDRIVPPASAAALGEAIPGAEILQPRTGHIGMVVSRGAVERVWQPLLTWLNDRRAVPH